MKRLIDFVLSVVGSIVTLLITDFRRRALARTALLLAFASLSPQWLAAQSAARGPTSAELELLRSLPPQQQRAVLEAISDSGGGEQRPEAPLQTPEVTAPAPSTSQAETPRVQADATLLPAEPVDTAALKPFGYHLFREVPTTFAPATDIPVPPDYAIGPGDTVIVELFGKKTGSYSLVVDREGKLDLPDLGPFTVAGLSFDQVRAGIERRMSERTFGVHASVTMGPLRSIRVFVLGDVVSPGSYTLSGLSSVTHALFLSGGISDAGSFRNTELKRGGATIGRLDLYDLLLRGDTSNDRRLQSSDVIFVPPVGPTVAIAGRVHRPAIYELRSRISAEELVDLAGGFTPDADPHVATLRRIEVNSNRVVLDVDLTSPRGRTLELQSGDVLTVPRVLDDLTRGITLAGQVLRPGRYEWHEGMRLTDLLEPLGALQALQITADKRYVLIRREHLPSRRIEVLSADLVRAFAERGSEADPRLQNLDRVIVFGMQSDRGAALGEVMNELRRQTRDGDATPVVTISGRVRAPGQYPLEAGMSVRDLVRAGGGLDESAYPLTAELTRFGLVNGEWRQTQVMELRLSDVLGGNAVADVALRAHDMLVVKSAPGWGTQGTITLAGEVYFPGAYPIHKGERLRSVVMRAGGLTAEAFVEGAVFTREEIKDQERRQIDVLATRLQSDLTLVALQSAGTNDQTEGASQAVVLGNSLLSQLRSARPIGRLVVDVGAALRRENSDQNIELRNGDVLFVPPRRPYVTVIGEVPNTASHVWQRGLSRRDYLDLSGGVTEKAKPSRIYVVRADGSVVADRSRSWFGGGGADMLPGDTVVVPMDTEKVRPLALWTAVTTVIYNLAIGAAAVGSL